MTDALGCSDQNTHTVTVNSSIVAVADFADTTICPGTTVDLRVTGGQDVSWTENAANPASGALSDTTGQTVTFDPVGGLGRYRFLATVTDAAAPGFSDTVTVTVTVARTATCAPDCSMPRLVDEVVVNADCAIPTGTISLTYDDAIVDYATEWRDAAGQVIGTNVLGLRDLGPGVYTMTATSVSDAACVFTKVVYLHATDAPRAVLVSATAAACDQSNGTVTVATPEGVVQWPDGSADLTRSDLPAGIYYVASYRPETPACRQYLRVDVAATNNLLVNVAVDNAPDCGLANGSVTLNTSGGSGDYDYDWPSGAATQTGLAAGIYEVTVTDRISGCARVVAVALANANPTAALTIQSVAGETCIGAADGRVAFELTVDPGAALPLDTVWTDAGGQTVTNGQLGGGNYCLTIFDASGCVLATECVEVTPAEPIVIDLTLLEACGDSGGEVTVRINDGEEDLTYSLDGTNRGGADTLTGIAAGSHTLIAESPEGCVAVVAFDMGACPPTDSFFVWRDTIFVGEGESLCLTPSQLGLAGPELSITNTCPEASGTDVDFFLDGVSDCVDYDGLAVGVEDACLRICDDSGACVEGSLIVTVVPRGDKIVVYDTVFVNQTSAYCPDVLLGDVALLRYPDTLLDGGLDSLGTCVNYRGLTLGTDTIDLVAAGASGSTRTPICVIVTVVPYDGDVDATPDATCTQRNTPVRVNVLANDEVFGGVASFRIVSPPDASVGDVVVNADNTVTFTPAADVCARDATFVYEVCNGNVDAPRGGCDEATVTICIECDPLTIFTLVTPNGDGMNETFWVEKIEEFPRNLLQIFNRWGTLVYETRGYRNEWAGTYLGDPLPDGTYYYLLDVEDAGETKTYNGYLEVLH